MSHYLLYNHQQAFGAVHHEHPSPYPSHHHDQVMQHPLALLMPASNMSAWPAVQAVHPVGSRSAQPFNPASTQVLPQALPTPMVHATPHNVEMEQGNITQTTIYQCLPMPMSHTIPYDVEMVNGDTRRQTIVHELPAPINHMIPAMLRWRRIASVEPQCHLIVRL